MTQKTGKRTGPRPLRRVIRHRVKSDVKISPLLAIKRIQTAGDRMTLQDTDPLVILRQTDSGRQPGHPRADNDRVINLPVVRHARSPPLKQNQNRRLSSFFFFVHRLHRWTQIAGGIPN